MVDKLVIVLISSSSWGIPKLVGWVIRENSIKKNGRWLEVPLFQETSKWICCLDKWMWMGLYWEYVGIQHRILFAKKTRSYPLKMTSSLPLNIAHLRLIQLLTLVIHHSYVSLPERKSLFCLQNARWNMPLRCVSIKAISNLQNCWWNMEYFWSAIYIYSIYTDNNNNDKKKHK